MNIYQQIFNRDSSLWSNDPQVRAAIDKRLGWLDPMQFSQNNHCAEINQFAEQVHQDGFQYVLLLGMGGSALAPEVFAQTFSTAKRDIQLLMLDSTCPEQISDFERRIDIEKTLFLVASKSGGTIETLSLFNYFYQRLAEQLGADNIGQQFVAITDEGTGLQALAAERQFRQCFVNPDDIGGRFSALSFFGLVPAALLGVSLETLFERVAVAVDECAAGNGLGVQLGEWLAQGYFSHNLDKLLIEVPDDLQPYFWWVEQLVAESLGKLGQGLLPVLSSDDSLVDTPQCKRLVVAHGEQPSSFASRQKASLYVRDNYDVAAHFFHWEFAIAIAGVRLEINPFDEPNVAQAKQQTQKLLDQYSATELPMPESDSLADLMGQLLEPDAYLAILAYWPENPQNRQQLQKTKQALQNRLEIPVTTNFGPRYLHSTGQLHKGGKPQGGFIVVVLKDSESKPIPGSPFDFAKLCRAQAMGDFASLQENGLPAIFLEVSDPGELANILNYS